MVVGPRPLEEVVVGVRRLVVVKGIAIEDELRPLPGRRSGPLAHGA